jgi:hypothetical protein
MTDRKDARTRVLSFKCGQFGENVPTLKLQLVKKTRQLPAMQVPKRDKTEKVSAEKKAVKIGNP